jgi:hypothetical protein
VGTNIPWDDTAISANGNVTFFPANETQASIELFVKNTMVTYLTAGKARGTTDLVKGSYQIRVGYAPDSPDPANEGFTIEQMYPH